MTKNSVNYNSRSKIRILNLTAYIGVCPLTKLVE